jgi:hypothetical protein
MSQPVEAEAVFSTFHFLRNLQLGPKGWSVFIALSWKCLSEPKTADYWAHSEIMKKIKYCKIDTKGHIHNTSLSSLLTNWPYRLKYYITLGWKGLPGTNTPAYWAHSEVIKKMNSY